jgi:transposase
MGNVTTLAIDLAKNVFQLHGVDDFGRVLLCKRVRRAQLLEVVAQLPPCVIGMEACASAHHWGRQFERLGHTVRLMSPQFVKPYVKSQKNDRADAEAICEAVRRPTMRFVPLKSLEQQDLLSAHRIRAGLISERTALINRIRGLLGEYGVVIARYPAAVKRELPQVLEEVQSELTVVARELIAQLREQLVLLAERIERVEQLMRQLGAQHEAVERLQRIPGIGPLTATALVAAAGDARAFKNGRQMAAWLGLVPRQDSTGGKTPLRGISKRGDKYLRCLLVHGARSVAYAAQRHPRPHHGWLSQVCARRGKHRAYVAQANKTVRIAWAVMARGEVYRPRQHQN